MNINLVRSCALNQNAAAKNKPTEYLFTGRKIVRCCWCFYKMFAPYDCRCSDIFPLNIFCGSLIALNAAVCMQLLFGSKFMNKKRNGWLACVRVDSVDFRLSKIMNKPPTYTAYSS